MNGAPDEPRPTLLVLASTYPRWAGDHEPGFVHELCERLTDWFRVIALVPDAPGADPSTRMGRVEVRRFRYAPRPLQSLVHGGGIATNLARSPWKWLLVPGFVLGQWWVARRILGRERVRVIHAHWLIPQGVVALALGSTVPYLVTSHGGDLFGLRGRLATALKRRVARGCAAMTVVSKAMLEEARNQGLRPASVQVLPMGVDFAGRFLADAGTEREADTLLFVGRLVPKKGLPHLIRALPRVLAARPGARLRVAGFGPEESTIRDLAERSGVSAAVEFLGAIPQERLPELYRRAALVVAPFVRDDSGNQEGMPVVLMEAIACGCPVLAGRVEGIEELLGEDAGSIVVDPRDTHAFAERILNVLGNPGQAVEAAARVRLRAVESVDWGVIAGRYAGLLASLAAPRSTLEGSARVGSATQGAGSDRSRRPTG